MRFARTSQSFIQRPTKNPRYGSFSAMYGWEIGTHGQKMVRYRTIYIDDYKTASYGFGDSPIHRL